MLNVIASCVRVAGHRASMRRHFQFCASGDELENAAGGNVKANRADEASGPAPVAIDPGAVNVFSIPPTRMIMQGLNVSVCFDNRTCGTFKRRAFLPCKNTDHVCLISRCETQQYVEDHENCHKKAAAWLLAWQKAGLETAVASNWDHPGIIPNQWRIEHFLSLL